MEKSADNEDNGAAISEERVVIVGAIGGAVFLGVVGSVIGGVFGGGAAILTWGGLIVGAIFGVASAVIIKRNPLELNPVDLKPLCTFNFHGGTWVYDSDEACSQTRDCPRCGLLSRRLEHDVLDWKTPSFTWRSGPWGSEEFGVCVRCQQMQRRKTPWSDNPP